MSYKHYPFYDSAKNPLTHENTFCYGYNGQWFSYRRSANDHWQIKYEKCRWKPGNFQEECIKAARLIRDSTSLPIEILFSGGRDSQTVVESFRQAGVVFTPIIMRYSNGLNDHDIAYAIDWCDSVGINYKTIDLDLKAFYDGPAWQYADDTYCVNELILPHFYAVDQCDGFPIIGSGDIIIAKNVHVAPNDNQVHWVERKNMGWDWNDRSLLHDGRWYLRDGEAIAANYRHFMIRNRHGVPAFFQYTPELMCSWLLEPEMKELVANPNKVSAWDQKYHIYNRFWNMKPRTKYDGLEYFWRELGRMGYHSKLRELYPNSWQYHRTEVQEFLTILTGDQNFDR